MQQPLDCLLDGFAFVMKNCQIEIQNFIFYPWWHIIKIKPFFLDFLSILSKLQNNCLIDIVSGDAYILDVFTKSSNKITFRSRGEGVINAWPVVYCFNWRNDLALLAFQPIRAHYKCSPLFQPSSSLLEAFEREKLHLFNRLYIDAGFIFNNQEWRMNKPLLFLQKKRNLMNLLWA